MANDHLKRKRILLVDDEPELLDMVVSILQEEGYLQIKTAKIRRRHWLPVVSGILSLAFLMLCCRMAMVSPCFKGPGVF